MKKIKLTQGQFALVDDEDFEYLNRFKWFAYKSKNTFYAKRDQRGIMIHRVIMKVTNPKVFIDHINGDGLDNQRSNLRLCNSSKNSMNRKPRLRCSSIYKGVCYHKLSKKWQASIGLNGHLTHLGLFDIESDAANAYNNKAKEAFGEFAKLNII